ncbi:MAG TPA: hypothetical protein VGG99_19900 [Acetobacteraceae bacterium]|jgi:hypothetical protein
MQLPWRRFALALTRRPPPGKDGAAMSLFVDHRNVVAWAWRADFGATARAA